MIDKNFILSLHSALIDATGGIIGIRSEALLESALAAPYYSAGGAELFPSIEQKAARLACGLIQNHAFLDGNKRIGIYAMLVFLESENIILRASDDELIELGLSLAKNETDYEKCYQWILSHKK